MTDTVNEKRREALFSLIVAGAFPEFAFATDEAVQTAMRTARANVESFGADRGKDSTAAIQKAIDSSPVVWIPPGNVYLIDTLRIPSNRRLIIDGVLRRIENARSDSYMIVNSNGMDGNSRIVIEGNGELDGNASAQRGDRQGLIRFVNPTNCSVTLQRAGNNRYDSRNPTTSGQGCIVFVNATRSHISVRNLKNWQREGLFIDGASVECSITNVTALGDGLDSWSAVSISGAGATRNNISDITAENCGASSVVCDSTFSTVDTIMSRNNQFHNGVNFGHTGKPATGTHASNITVLNAAQAASSGSGHSGIQVGGGTTDLELSNITVNGAYNHCIQISDHASRIRLTGKNRLSGAKHGSGVNAYGADQVTISGTTATGNSDYGVNFNSGNDCVITDSDLRGNKLGGFMAASKRIRVQDTLCSGPAKTCSAD